MRSPGWSGLVREPAYARGSPLTQPCVGNGSFAVVSKTSTQPQWASCFSLPEYINGAGIDCGVIRLIAVDAGCVAVF